MAINCFDIKSCNKVSPMSECSTNISKKYNFSSRLDNLDFTDKGSVASVTSRLKKSYKSPYLVGDKSQPTTRAIEKKAVRKEKAVLVSSFPLAVRIYKANSDEFKSIKSNRKVKKSVLTLPNQRCSKQERCTVSDMNDSEYLNNDEVSHKARPKKRIPRQSNKKFRNRPCSYLNADLDSSSTDMIRHFDGDGRRVAQRKKPYMACKSQAEKQFSGHNVWKVLRDMNRFQFRPSPPASDDTIVTPRKKKVSKRYKKKDSRFIGSCHTEEYAYISNIEVDSKSKSFSQSSSFDRITVIDKQDDFNKLCEEFEKTIVRTHNLAKDVSVNNCKPAKNKNHIKNKPRVNKLYKFKDRQMKSIDNTATVMRNENHFEDENYRVNFIVPNENTISKPKYPIEHSKNHLNIIKSELNEETDDKDEFLDHFIHSGNSGSSKAACNYLKDNELSFKLSSNESSQHIKGITKVVLRKDQDIKNLQKRKQRLFTTIPSTTITPKLTQTDIKRRLARIKFPLVILDKDQVSSTMEVIDSYEHPQFAGLDKHIWPFMLEWNNELSKTGEYIKSHKNIENNVPKTKRYTVQVENKLTNLRKSNKTVTKEKKVHNIESLINQKLKVQDQPIPEIKRAIHPVKNKMLELLYKKSPAINLYDVAQQVGGGDVKNVTSKTASSKNDIGDNRNLMRSSTVKDPLKKRQMNPVNPANMKDRLSTMKITKTKTNLVDTIAMNIKNGVYYNEDTKYFENKQMTISKEASIQTTLKDIQEIQTDQVECLKSSTSMDMFNKCHSLLEAIPGFDYTLPELEIKILNFNKIEVKHCLSNIVVQFDVTTLPMNPNINLKGFKKSYSFIPIEVTDCEPKVFKCKTSILNATLPAELCSILPKIIRNLIISEMKSLPLLPVSKNESHLSTISELSHFEIMESLKMSQVVHLRGFFDGLFFKHIQTNPKLIINKFEWPGRTRILEILPPISNKLIIPCDLSPRQIVYIRELRKVTPLNSPSIREITSQKRTYCTTVQSYDSRNWRIATIFKPYDFNNVISKILAYYSSAFVASTISLITFYISTNRLSVNITLNKDNQEKMLLSVNDLKTDKSYGNFSNILSNKIECSNGNIMNINEIPVRKNESLNSQIKRSTTRLRRKGYVKLYKKCKSTTNIPTERQSTSLNKIENLDVFFQLLGCRKSFSGVCDGHAGRGVMSSISEMKNWISEINSSQALLVLLLVNKKDTTNLVRFRSILLQGIAVNRITKVSELDMEIEVIERENFNSFLQIEGMSYLPASVENKDNLLEELYWIAKTTASDYQKPFDESSENHLKSLLERRKKLNPSYLRLMARYVGLGLLKSPLRK